jgi:hypothetical protein
MTDSIRTAPPAAASARTGRRVAVVLGLWAGAVALASAAGWLAAVPTAVIAPLVVLGIALPSLAYALTPALRTWAAGIGLWWLTALHVWRIAAAGVFFWYGSQGRLPDLFVINAGWGDLAAGLLALAVVLAPRAGRRSYAAVHLFGFADFVVAVGTGLTFTLLGDPLMATIREFPLALIPLFGVGVSGTVHVIAFHLLWTGRGQPTAT